jgi:cell division septation protein DedD
LQADGAQPMSATADEGEPAEAPTTVASGESEAASSETQPSDATRTEAENAVPPTVASSNVDAEPAEAAPVASPPVNVPRSGFSVQVGSFGSRDNATRLVRQLQDKGFPAYIAAPTSGSTPGLARVRVGPVSDRAAAAELAARLQRAGQKSTAIVPNS